VYYYDRVGRVPVLGDPFDVDAFLAQRVAHDENAADLYLEAIRAARTLVAPENDEEPAIRKTRGSAGLIFLDWENPLADEARFIQLSDRAFQLAKRASLMPKAMFYDPAETGAWDTGAELSELQELSNIVRKRGELLAARGDREAALDHFLVAVRMGRHCAQMSGYMQHSVGIVIETFALHSLQEWAGDPEITADIAVRAVAEFKSLRPERASPDDPVKVHYLWVRRMLDSDPAAMHRLFAQKKPTALAQLFGLRSPFYGPFAGWERERARRLLVLLTDNHLHALALDAVDRPKNLPALPQPTARLWNLRATSPQVNFFLNDYNDAEQLAYWLDDTPLLAAFAPWYQSEIHYRIEVQRRSTLLILALRAHQVEHGTYPNALIELEGQHLDKLPTDPFSGKPFGYVLSTGQEISSYTITLPHKPYQTRPGQLLLYSVGPDQIDHGGTIDWGFYWNRPADWLFPVPDLERDR
jgi:hypothetical protein